MTIHSLAMAMRGLALVLGAGASLGQANIRGAVQMIINPVAIR